MDIFIYILVFCTVALWVLIVYEFIFFQRRVLNEKLEQIRKMGGASEETDELNKSFVDRLIMPAFNKFGRMLADLTPKEIRNNIDKKLIYAGKPWNMNFNNFLVVQVVVGVILAAFILLLISLTGDVDERSIIITLLVFMFGLYLPVIIINSKISKRQAEIQKSMPDFLDLLLVSVEAGLGFDMALKRVSEKTSGELSVEINRAAEEIRRGRRREEAFKGVVKRTGVKDLAAFVSAVIQAEQLGSNITDTLRVQAISIREKRRQRIEEQAMKAPIKMLFPLIFFIFPALFVVLLGPAAIQMIQVFSDMF